jgi:hypothetical protein
MGSRDAPSDLVVRSKRGIEGIGDGQCVSRLHNIGIHNRILQPVWRHGKAEYRGAVGVNHTRGILYPRKKPDSSDERG